MIERKKLLSQNRDLRPHGIFNWTLPALVARLSDGRKVTTCTAAGACARVCFARNGTFLFSNVIARHVWNLELTIDRPDLFKAWMIEECQEKPGRWVRIHDSGDFYSDEYLLLWLDIIRACPDVNFYCYTKEVSRFRRLVEAKPGQIPRNFQYVFSLGGTEDHLIDRARDRHADVFPDEASINEAGYSSQNRVDTDCVTLPTNRIGIPANNIAHFRKIMDGRTFSAMETERRKKRERGE